MKKKKDTPKPLLVLILPTGPLVWWIRGSHFTFLSGECSFPKATATLCWALVHSWNQMKKLKLVIGNCVWSTEATKIAHFKSNIRNKCGGGRVEKNTHTKNTLRTHCKCHKFSFNELLETKTILLYLLSAEWLSQRWGHLSSANHMTFHLLISFLTQSYLTQSYPLRFEVCPSSS